MCLCVSVTLPVPLVVWKLIFHLNLWKFNSVIFVSFIHNDFANENSRTQFEIEMASTYFPISINARRHKHTGAQAARGGWKHTHTIPYAILKWNEMLFAHGWAGKIFPEKHYCKLCLINFCAPAQKLHTLAHFLSFSSPFPHGCAMCMLK